jgi:hypothetical protein
MVNFQSNVAWLELFEQKIHYSTYFYAVIYAGDSDSFSLGITHFSTVYFQLVTRWQKQSQTKEIDMLRI